MLVYTVHYSQDIQIGTVDIFVKSQPKWQKFGLQAHFERYYDMQNFSHFHWEMIEIWESKLDVQKSNLGSQLL